MLLKRMTTVAAADLNQLAADGIKRRQVDMKTDAASYGICTAQVHDSRSSHVFRS